MKTYKLVLGIASTVAIGMMVYRMKKTRLQKRLIDVAEAGYETAYDVLYPLKLKKIRRR